MNWKMMRRPMKVGRESGNPNAVNRICWLMRIANTMKHRNVFT